MQIKNYRGISFFFFGLAMIILPVIAGPFLSISGLNLTIARINETDYVATMTGGLSRENYELQYHMEGVIMPWTYGGRFVSDVEGVIVTFPLYLAEVGRPYVFRMIEISTSQVSNEVTIDPSNPPPIDTGDPEEPELPVIMVLLDCPSSYVTDGNLVTFGVHIVENNAPVIGDYANIYVQNPTDLEPKFLGTTQMTDEFGNGNFTTIVSNTWFTGTNCTIKAIYDGVESSTVILYKNYISPIPTNTENPMSVFSGYIQLAGGIVAAFGFTDFWMFGRKKE